MSFTFRCVDPVADAPLLHSWVTQPYAAFWGMQSATVEAVVEEYSNDPGQPGITMPAWGSTAASPPS